MLLLHVINIIQSWDPHKAALLLAWVMRFCGTEIGLDWITVSQFGVGYLNRMTANSWIAPAVWAQCFCILDPTRSMVHPACTWGASGAQKRCQLPTLSVMRHLQINQALRQDLASSDIVLLPVWTFFFVCIKIALPFTDKLINEDEPIVCPISAAGWHIKMTAANVNKGPLTTAFNRRYNLFSLHSLTIIIWNYRYP